jgi:hypothetical protein
MLAHQQNLIVTTPWLVKADFLSGKREISFETSREGVIDRENEDIAVKALEDSKELFLAQGNIDINHWSWLGNPYGTEARPEYVIGRPTAVKREGKSLFVKAEIFNTSGMATVELPNGHAMTWADYFWQTINANPPMQWFPSVFGRVLNARIEERQGKKIRYIDKVEWYSVGLAQRAQHPELSSVVVGGGDMFSKADLSFQIPEAKISGALVMDYATFAKAVTAVGAPITDTAQMTGVQAITPTSLEGTYAKMKGKLVKRILKGEIAPQRDAIRKAFSNMGLDHDTAKEYAVRLLTDTALLKN